MRRLAGSRLGATSTLSVVLALGALSGLPASGQAAELSGGSAGTASRADAELADVGAAAARSATEVELARPVRGARAVRLLGDRLDEAAALNDLSEAELVELLTTDPTAWLDRSGAVFFKDEVAPAPADDPVSAQAPLAETFQLHSRPGSTKKIYLDFDGGAAGATAWQAGYPATPTTQPAWDLTGNAGVFDDTERTAIQTIWQSVAEDYAPFDVDVTTADPGPAGIHRTGAADAAYGSHVLVTPSIGAQNAICPSGCGGVAYLSVFDTVNGNGGGAGGDGYGYMQPAWVFPQMLGHSPKNIAEAVSHEVGHNLGLSHDGNPGQGYDTGHGAWAPIMGVGYDRPVSQWSKGDYPGATNQEDDVAIIRAVAGSRTDEAPTGIAGAGAVPGGTAYVTSRTDVDTYLLGTCTGSVTVDADPLATMADLDLTLSLLDATGQVVATNDPASGQTDVSTASGLDASLTRTLGTGTYYASVDGVGSGTWSTGYDDYGSMGAYTLAATGCDGAAPTGTPSAPTGASAAAHASDPTATVTWAAPTSAGSSAVTGYLLTRTGDDTAVQVAATTTSYTWTGLASSTAYSFTVTALNARGAGPSVTVTATTATGTARPSAPQNLSAIWDGLNQRALFFYSAPATSGSYPVTAYDIYLDGDHAGRTAGTAVGISPLDPGTHTLGVAAVNQAGTGTLATTSVVVPVRATNDAFAQRSTLSGVSGSISGDNTESSAETGEPAPPATRTDAGGASVWYSWTAPASGPVTMTTSSSVSGRDTTLAAYSGTSLGTLTQVAGNDDASGSTRLSSVQFTATAGTTYAVAVDGYRTTAAGVGSFSLTWAGTAAVASGTTTTLGSAVAGRSATLTAAVTATSGSPAGSVELRDGGVLVSTRPLASGSASVTLSDLTRGGHDFRATFVPTDSALFTTSKSSVVTSTIAATTSTTTLTATGGVRSVDLTAGVTVAAGTATGTVELREGAALVGSATVSGGAASLTLTGVTAGQHTYTAVFVPADTQRYDGSSSPNRTVTVTDPVVTKATTTALTADASGRSATLGATVTATSGTPQGSVQFRDGTTVVGNVPLAGGSASLQVTDLLRGSHSFTAEFVPGDPSQFVASQSGAATLEVAATPTSTSLTTSVTGRSVSLQASISPAFAGTVRFREGSTVLGTATVASGAAALTVPGVPAGSHGYTAAFVPADDTRHAPSTSTHELVDVVATPTTTTLGSAVSDHQVTLTATVTSSEGSPAGTVQLREGGTLLATRTVSAGTASAVITDVATGSHDYTATFVPTSPTSYAGSASAVHTRTVVATPTTTGLVATASGSTVTLSATPTAGSGTLVGNVVFREGTGVVGTVPVAAGPTVLQLTSVAPGSHAYSATFEPTGTTHAASTSPTRTVTVDSPEVPTPEVPTPPTTTPTPTPTTPPSTGTPTTPATPVLATSTTKVTAPKKAKAGTRPVVTVNVKRGPVAASGTVVVTYGKKSRTLTLKAGTATLKLPKLTAGKVAITVRYLGDPTTAASTATWTIKVKG